jgi:hypothetical protein
MLVANAVVYGVIRGAWLVVADGLAAWSPAFLVRGTIHKPVRVHFVKILCFCHSVPTMAKA